MRKMQKPNGLYFSLLTTIEISNNQVYILRDYVFSTLVLLKYALSEKIALLDLPLEPCSIFLIWIF
jgi:hypothetical protein